MNDDEQPTARDSDGADGVQYEHTPLNTEALYVIHGVNILIDRLVVAHPETKATLAAELRVLRRANGAAPDTAMLASAFGMMLRSLERSARSLQRDPPAGAAD